MSLLITGGTGFFGRALIRHLESQRISHGTLPYARITILSRNPERFRAQYPSLGELPWIHWHAGDVLVPDSLPRQQRYEYILHAATDSTDSAAMTPLKQYDQIAQGTENMLQFALHCGARRFLLTSSGGAYGPQPADMLEIPESYNGMPSPLALGSVYGIAKRQAEHLCFLYGRQYGIETVIARCFAFVGEDLALNAHFAIGNFIRDALTADAITVSGDGSPLRSYLDQRDLSHWLLTMLSTGDAGHAYNVGSNQAISIRDLAHKVRDLIAPEKPVRVLGENILSTYRNRYIPCITKAQKELGLNVSITLDAAIQYASNAKVTILS